MRSYLGGLTGLHRKLQCYFKQEQFTTTASKMRLPTKEKRKLCCNKECIDDDKGQTIEFQTLWIRQGPTLGTIRNVLSFNPNVKQAKTVQHIKLEYITLTWK